MAETEARVRSQSPLVALRAYARQRLLTLTVICVTMAALGQYLFDHRALGQAAAMLYWLAALLFVGLYGAESLAASGAILPTNKRRLNWFPVLGAMALGVLAFPRFSGDHFTPDGTLVWALGLVLLGIAAWSPKASVAEANVARADDAREKAAPLNEKGLLFRWTHVALLGVMALGAFFRLYKIDQIPLEMGCDLPHVYNNIRLILRGEFLIFFPSFPGREGLFFYLAALLARVFGLSHTTIKIAATLVGVFTLPVVYLLGKELYNRWVGLVAAFLLSISHWHIILTRVGYRACTLPLVLSLMWYFLVRGFKTHRRWFFGLAGFFLGLGMYTYNAFMIVPPLVVLMLLTLVVTGRGRTLLFHWDNILLMALVAVYVFIPLGRYAYEQPQMYGYRAATRITGLESALPQDILGTLARTTMQAFLMFNVRGDGVFIANVPYLRELGFLTAVFFVLGLAYLIWRWREGYNLMVLLTLGGMLLPTILSLAFPQEVPNAIRAIGALPPVMLSAAVGATLVGRQVIAHYKGQPTREWNVGLAVDGERRIHLRWDASRVRWTIACALLILPLALEARAAYPVYFERYVQHLPARNYSISLEMARAIDDFADDGEAYIKMVPYWYDGNAVRAQLRRADQNWSNELDTLRPDRPPLSGPAAKFMAIVHPQDTATLQTLRNAFPQGIELEHYDFDGQVAFITFYGER